MRASDCKLNIATNIEPATPMSQIISRMIQAEARYYSNGESDEHNNQLLMLSSSGGATTDNTIACQPTASVVLPGHNIDIKLKADTAGSQKMRSKWSTCLSRHHHTISSQRLLPSTQTPRFHETDSSTNDSDGSTSKGRRRFRLGCKRESWKISHALVTATLATKNFQQQSPSLKNESLSERAIENFAMVEVFLSETQNLMSNDTHSDVSSLSCLDLYGDSEWLDDCDSEDVDDEFGNVAIKNESCDTEKSPRKNQAASLKGTWVILCHPSQA